MAAGAAGECALTRMFRVLHAMISVLLVVAAPMGPKITMIGEPTVWTKAATDVIVSSVATAEKQRGRSMACVVDATALAPGLIDIIDGYHAIDQISNNELYLYKAEVAAVRGDDKDWCGDIVHEIIGYLFDDTQMSGWSQHYHDANSQTMCLVCLRQFAMTWPRGAHVALCGSTMRGKDLIAVAATPPRLPTVIVTRDLQDMILQNCRMHLMISTADNVQFGSVTDHESVFDIHLVPTEDDILSPFATGVLYSRQPSGQWLNSRSTNLRIDGPTGSEEPQQPKDVCTAAQPRPSWALHSDHHSSDEAPCAIEVPIIEAPAIAQKQTRKVDLHAHAHWVIRHLRVSVLD